MRKRLDSSYIHTENEEQVLLKVKTMTTNFGDERRSEAVIASFKDRHKRRKVITSPNNIVHKGRQACMKVTKYLTTDGFVLISTPSAIVDGIRTFVVDEKLIAGPCEKWSPQTEEEEEPAEIKQPVKIKNSKADLPTKNRRGRPAGSKDLKPRKKRGTRIEK